MIRKSGNRLLDKREAFARIMLQQEDEVMIRFNLIDHDLRPRKSMTSAVRPRWLADPTGEVRDRLETIVAGWQRQRWEVRCGSVSTHSGAGIGLPH